MKFYIVGPAFAGWLGGNTISEPSPSGVVVSRLHVVVQSWPAAPLLKCAPCFIVTAEAADAIARAGLSGAELDAVEVSVSEDFRGQVPEGGLTGFAWLKINGEPGVDDFGRRPGEPLVISERALGLLQSLGFSEACVRPHAPSETTLAREPEDGGRKVRDSLADLVRRGGIGRSSLIGCNDDEIARLEGHFGCRLPAAYDAFMRVAGKGAGHLFQGTDILYPRVLELRRGAEELLEENDLARLLPEDAKVFSLHQGYVLYYFTPTSDDPPVYVYVEGNPGISLEAPSFSAFLAATIDDEFQVRRELGRKEGGILRRLSWLWGGRREDM